MTDSARVSVCMATYNGERYIEDQLNSILVQLSPTDEVIIVDDASRDRTVEIINEMGDDRVRLIRHDVNRGVLASFERAIRSATGQIIFLSDQDDLWASNKVSEFLKAFLDHPEAAVVISDATLINERDEVIAASKFATRPFRPGLLANLLHSRFIGCMMAFRSTLLPSVLPFPHGLDILHDIWIGTTNSIFGGTTWHIDKPLTLYRFHGSNMTAGIRLSRRRQVRLRIHLLWALALLCFRRLRSKEEPSQLSMASTNLSKITHFRNTNSAAQLNLCDRPQYLIVINDIGFLYSHFWELATSIQRAGWDVTIAARSGAFPQRITDAGMQFMPLKLETGIGGALAEIKSALALRRAIRSCGPDVVHLISLKNVLVGGLLVRGRKDTALIGAITGLGSMFVGKRLLYSMLRPLVLLGLRHVFRNSRSVMALENPDDRNFFIKSGVVGAERSFLIPGAGLRADAIVPRPRKNNVPVVLCACRMIRDKGILQLIEAARILLHEGLQFELLLAGDIHEDNPTSLTREELRSAETDGAVKWLGHRSDVLELLNRADIFCLPSYYREGLPRSLVEASAAGCAIVTTDVPGCREVVANKVNGILVAPRNAGALADALRSLIRDPKACETMGIESRRRFEQLFTQASVFEAFSRCYAALDLSLQV